MKPKAIILFLLFSFFALCAYSQNEIAADASNEPITTIDTEQKASDTSKSDEDLIVKGKLGVGVSAPAEKVDVQGAVKASEGFCIGDDCKKQWPSLKCATYSDRPSGETGEEYCKSIGKECFAVSIGSGASFFGDCDTSPAATHKVRCCSVE
ncbi:MAG: hypothetical protein KJ880_05875 [Candidatus Omnitrophica bacterium]|nr:hypothetical protein [Candidatus Omnitrophota bacterium]MBU1869850.1 hypothetical protein [Candidatus Omnitrophota bacterium]